MYISDLQTIAIRLELLVRDAHEFGQNRVTILNLVEEIANDLYDQADELSAQMEKELRDDREYLSSL